MENNLVASNFSVIQCFNSIVGQEISFRPAFMIGTPPALIFSLQNKKKAIIKFKVLEFAFAHDDLFSQGTHISSGPWLRKHKMVQPLTWQDQMSCMLCCFRCTSRDTAPNSHLNSTFLETWQQQRYKLMMKLLEKKYFQINPRKMADILLSLK